MNLDYVFTNEFGEQVLSDDPSKGIPTKGKYRFKMKWQNEEGLQNSFQRANFLVPNVKEYGWSTSGNDPFDQATQTYTYQIQPGLVTGVTEVQSFGFDAGISFETSLNNSSYEIYLNGVLYTGSQNSIPFNVGDTIQIVGTSVNPNVTQDFTFKVYPETLFNLLKSYAFSLDWDDYVNPQEAIDCEDTFYEFKYNKVYTTAMFLDRYKNGIGRARHLGIKEIDKTDPQMDEIIPENITLELETISDVERSLLKILRMWSDVNEIVPLGDKWKGGLMLLQPADKSQKPKEVPVDVFFHKIVMLRDRLRVMEQQINAHKILSDEEKVNLQQYITRIYGTLTTFNVLFKNKEHWFVGEKGGGD
jgi:hypothetical protein